MAVYDTARSWGTAYVVDMVSLACYGLNAGRTVGFRDLRDILVKGGWRGAVKDTEEADAGQSNERGWSVWSRGAERDAVLSSVDVR
jgi:hypothetical protein